MANTIYLKVFIDRYNATPNDETPLTLNEYMRHPFKCITCNHYIYYRRYIVTQNTKRQYCSHNCAVINETLIAEWEAAHKQWAEEIKIFNNFPENKN